MLDELWAGLCACAFREIVRAVLVKRGSSSLGNENCVESLWLVGVVFKFLVVLWLRSGFLAETVRLLLRVARQVAVDFPPLFLVVVEGAHFAAGALRGLGLVRLVAGLRAVLERVVELLEARVRIFATSRFWTCFGLVVH